MPHCGYHLFRKKKQSPMGMASDAPVSFFKNILQLNTKIYQKRLSFSIFTKGGLAVQFPYDIWHPSFAWPRNCRCNQVLSLVDGQTACLVFTKSVPRDHGAGHSTTRVEQWHGRLDMARTSSSNMLTTPLRVRIDIWQSSKFAGKKHIFVRCPLIAERK